MKKIRYSEVFSSAQFEGHYTGTPTVWLRLWGCNFECNGFGQDNPRDKSTWVLPYKDVDLSHINRIEDLPVFTRGCDSSYSYQKRFSHLAHLETADQITSKLISLLTNEHNPEGNFCHQKSGQQIHMAFTGGEPLMNQKSIISVMDSFENKGNLPLFTTVETNGTFELKEDLIRLIIAYRKDQDGEWFWSCSPKLSLSGENWDEAIKPDVIAGYSEISDTGQLKYVVDGSDRAWDEVDLATEKYRQEGVDFPVWIMPMGGTFEQQTGDHISKIADETIARGYNFSARVQNYVYGNAIGK